MVVVAYLVFTTQADGSHECFLIGMEMLESSEFVSVPLHSFGGRMKKLWPVFRTGLSVLVPIFIFVGFLLWLWNTLVAISRGHIWIALGILPVGILVVGWLVSQRWFRGSILKFCEDIPVISIIANFLLNDAFIDQVKSGNLLKEVEWEISKDVCAPGIVMGHEKRPRYWKRPEGPNNPIVNWVRVIDPTTPFAATGFPRWIPESEVVYTGYTAADTLLGVASFLFNMQRDYKKRVYPKEGSTEENE